MLGKVINCSLAECLLLLNDTHLPQLKAKTVLIHKNSIKNLDRLIDLNRNDISKDDIFGFIETRRSEGVTDRTIEIDLTTLSLSLDLAIERDLLDNNVLKSMRLKKILKKSDEKIRFLTVEQYHALLDKIKSDYLKNLVVIAVNTGLRREELLPLEWGQIRNSEIYLPLTKTGVPRNIPIPPPVKDILDNLEKTSNYVINNPKTNTRIYEIKRGFKTALKKADIKDFRWHDLRHTFGTWAVKGLFSWQAKPMDIYRVSKWMGHSNIKTTQIYAKLHIEDLHSEVMCEL